MNVVFFPMFTQGIAGMSRRMYDGGVNYSQAANKGLLGALPDSAIYSNVIISIGAWMLLLAQIPFIFNFFWSMRNGRKVESDNPWDATTLEWQTPTPPPHGNFAVEPTVYRGPYEYSVPGAVRDFIPQNEIDNKGKAKAPKS
jgi:cytochrome c oxidase subunit 1